AGNEAHAGRLLPRAVREDADALRARLRAAFTFAGDAAVDPAFAPLLARALDRAAKARAALGSRARWTIVRAQKSDAGSRYEIGLGVDLRIASDLDQLATRLQSADRRPSPDPEIEAALQSMTPRGSEEDPEGRWFLERCGLQTVQRLDAKTAF